MKLPQRLEMTITRADFRRLLPAAVSHLPYTEEDGAYAYAEGARSWRISLAPLPLLRIGLIRLERHQVDFQFAGYSAEEIERFRARFEAYFCRGGG